MPEGIYDEWCLIIIPTEEAELNLKHGSLFADLSKRNEKKTQLNSNDPETKAEHMTDQSHVNRTFDSENSVNKIQQNETSVSEQSDTSTPKISRPSNNITIFNRARKL